MLFLLGPFWCKTDDHAPEPNNLGNQGICDRILYDHPVNVQVLSQHELSLFHHLEVSRTGIRNQGSDPLFANLLAQSNQGLGQYG